MENLDILKRVKDIEQEIITTRRDLHQIPELQLNLPKTVAYVSNKLDEMGIPYRKLVDGNAIVAEIKGNGDGKCIGIRADMDGLPIKENTGLPFTSKHDGCMHACGHDGHMAMALGAAKILKDLSSSFKGTVKMLFQPAEEFPGGAKPMIDEGAMENPKVDAVIGLHQGHLLDTVPVGKLGVCHGVFFASMDRFRIYVKGKGSHGAQPQSSVDPIPIACEIVTALQRIISREISPTDTALVSVCQIHSGTSQNIIPDEAFLEGTVRTTNEETRKHIAKRIDEIADGIAKAHRGSAETIYDFKYPVLENNKAFTEFFMKNTAEVLGEDSMQVVTVPTMGGEDMAFFLQEAPGTFFLLSNPIVHEGGVIYPHHTEKFDVDESMFYMGTSAMVATALKYLQQ